MSERLNSKPWQRFTGLVVKKCISVGSFNHPVWGDAKLSYKGINLAEKELILSLPLYCSCIQPVPLPSRSDTVNIHHCQDTPSAVQFVYLLVCGQGCRTKAGQGRPPWWSFFVQCTAIFIILCFLTRRSNTSSSQGSSGAKPPPKGIVHNASSRRRPHRITTIRSEEIKGPEEIYYHFEFYDEIKREVDPFKLQDFLSDECNQKVEELTADSKNGFFFKVKPIFQLNLLSDIKNFEAFSCVNNFHRFLNHLHEKLQFHRGI